MAYICYREDFIGCHEVVVLQVCGDVNIGPCAACFADQRSPAPVQTATRRTAEVAVSLYLTTFTPSFRRINCINSTVSTASGSSPTTPNPTPSPASEGCSTPRFPTPSISANRSSSLRGRCRGWCGRHRGRSGCGWPTRHTAARGPPN